MSVLRILRQCYTEIKIETRFGFNEWLLGEDAPKMGARSADRTATQLHWQGSNLAGMRPCKDSSHAGVLHDVPEELDLEILRGSVATLKTAAEIGPR